jgi:putative pyruvate formate lyase activating enzyme
MWRTESFPDVVVRKSLARYFAVVEGKKTAKVLIAKKVAANFTETDSLEILWMHHAKCIQNYCVLENQIDNDQDLSSIATPEKTYFDLKIQIAHKILEHCHLCSRRCSINRLDGQLGYCGCGKTLSVSSIFTHTGEEPELVPSGTIFTMGCTIRCRHCQNWTISQWKETPTEYEPEELAREVENLTSAGCRNVNLVGGEPTPWLKHWLETFTYVGVNVPVVWNSNSYYSIETAQLLAGFSDVYLLDFKYGPGDCAMRISDAPNYWQVCTRNHLEAKKYGELLIRILVLPRHLECCTKPILNWIADNLGAQTRVNLMFQYRPQWRANEISELSRKLTRTEMDKALELTKHAGLKNLLT